MPKKFTLQTEEGWIALVNFLQVIKSNLYYFSLIFVSYLSLGFGRTKNLNGKN